MAVSKLQRIYRKLRVDGSRASNCLRAARIIADFEALESQGLVRIRVETDNDPDYSFMGEFSDKWQPGAIDRKKAGDYERNSYRYFIPANPEYASADYKLMKKCMEEGAYGTIGEWRASSMDEKGEPLGDDEGWEQCDSVWGHMGYKDPSSPYENDYVIDHMRACIDAYRDSVTAALGNPV